MIRKLGFLLSFVLISTFAVGAISTQDRAKITSETQLLDNPGFEARKAGWTPSGSSTLVMLTGNNALNGKLSGRWDASANGEFLTSRQFEVKGLRGGQCLAQFGKYLWESGTAGHIKLQAIDGSLNVLKEVDLTVTQGVPLPGFIVYTCPSNATDTVALRLASTADAAAIDLDDAHNGSNIRKVEVASSEVFGVLTHDAVTNCIWTSTSGSYASFAVDAQCTSQTVIGRVAAPDTLIPAVKIPVMPPGRYKISANGVYFTDGISNDTTCFYRLNDAAGSGRFGNALRIGDNGGQGANNTGLAGVLEVSTTRTDVEIDIQVNRTAGTGTCEIRDSSTVAEEKLEFIIERFPLESETAQTIDTIGWHIDANIGGANPSLGTASVTSYTGIENSGLDMVVNPGSKPAVIGCSGTNSPGTTTCSSGDESISVSFTPLKAGKYEACFSFIHATSPNDTGGSDVEAVFQVVETPLAAQTISNEGNTRIGTRYRKDTTSNNEFVAWPVTVCGLFLFNSVEPKMVRLMYEQNVVNVPNSNAIAADRSATFGQRDIHVTVRPWTQDTSAAVIGESIINPGNTAPTKIFAAEVEFTGGTPSLIAEVGSWVDSITDIGVGVVQLNFITNTWTVSPTCTCTSQDNATGFKACFVTDDVEPNATAMRFSNFVASTGTATDDGSIHIHCMGQ